MRTRDNCVHPEQLNFVTTASCADSAACACNLSALVVRALCKARGGNDSSLLPLLEPVRAARAAQSWPMVPGRLMTLAAVTAVARGDALMTTTNGTNWASCQLGSKQRLAFTSVTEIAFLRCGANHVTISSTEPTARHELRSAIATQFTQNGTEEHVTRCLRCDVKLRAAPPTVTRSTLRFAPRSVIF